MAASGALGGAVSGAGAGASVAGPWGAAVGAVAGGVLGSMSGGGTVPTYFDPFSQITSDFSNWTVATGGSKASATNSDEQGAMIPDWLKFAAMGLAAVVAVRWIARNN